MTRLQWLLRSISVRFGDDMLRTSLLLRHANRRLLFYGLTVGQLCIGVCWSRRKHDAAPPSAGEAP